MGESLSHTIDSQWKILDVTRVEVAETILPSASIKENLISE